MQLFPGNLLVTFFFLQKEITSHSFLLNVLIFWAQLNLNAVIRTQFLFISWALIVVLKKCQVLKGYKT